MNLFQEIRNCIGKMVLILLLGVLSLSGLFVVSAAEGENLKVGYSVAGSMLYKDENGHYKGYDAALLYEIARYTGWNYTFVPYKSWAKAVDDVRDGKIDILPTVLKNGKRENEMIFSEHAMATTYVALIRRGDDDRFVFGSLDGINGASIGVRKGTKDAEDFLSWAAKNHITYRLKEYTNRDTLLKGLENKEIDLAATSYAGIAQNYPSVMEFAPQDMFFAINPKRGDVAVALNRAMADSMLYNSLFTDSTLRLTQTNHKRYYFYLSEEDRKYIETLPELKVAVLTDREPFCYERHGEMQGITIRILEEIGKLTGLHFTYVPMKNRFEGIEMMRDGRADMVAINMGDPARAQTEGIRLTTPYYHGNLALLQRVGKEDGPKGAAKSLVKSEFRDKAEYNNYPTFIDSLRAFEKGEIDGLYCDVATAWYYANTLDRRAYRMETLPGFFFQLSFSTDQKSDIHLGIILDRAIQFLNDTKTDEIVQEETNRAPITMTGILTRLSSRQMNVLFIALLALVLVFFYFTVNLYRRRGLERRMDSISRMHDSMAASLEAEKKTTKAQQELYRYLHESISGPLRKSQEKLGESGAGDPGHPAHEAWKQGEEVQEFMDSMNLLNSLIYSEDKDNREFDFLADTWKYVPCRKVLEREGALLSNQAFKGNRHFSMDFSGVANHQVLIGEKLFSSILSRTMKDMILFTPEGSDILFSAALSNMVGDEKRAVLWVFFSCPKLPFSSAIMTRAESISRTKETESQSIYEKLIESSRYVTADERHFLIDVGILTLLVQKMGGQLEFRSSETQGTEISLEFFLSWKD